MICPDCGAPDDQSCYKGCPSIPSAAQPPATDATERPPHFCICCGDADCYCSGSKIEALKEKLRESEAHWNEARDTIIRLRHGLEDAQAARDAYTDAVMGRDEAREELQALYCSDYCGSKGHHPRCIELRAALGAKEGE